MHGSLPVIIFSDLDGTLLDHETYAFTEAAPALEALKNKAIPLILASSKTAAEMRAIRDQIGCGAYPAIVENGAGILPPDGSAEDQARPTRQKLVETLNTMPDGLRKHFHAWSDMTVAGITGITGLPEDAAQRAADRQFSEPGTWDGTPEDLQRFLHALAENGVEARQGGRFITLSFGSDKAKRMDEVRRHLFADMKVLTVALGDAPNDIGMLKAADFGVIVANPAHDPLEELPGEANGKLVRTEKPGPAGWNEAVLSLLSKIEGGKLG